MTKASTQAWFDYAAANINMAECGLISIDGLTARLSHADKEEEPDKPRREAWSAHRNIFRLLTAHVIDNFQTYLSDLIYQILEIEPRITFGKKFDIKLLYDVPDLEAAKRRIVARYVMDLGYRNAADLADTLRSDFKLHTMSGWLTKRRLNRLVQIRNVIAHNRSRTNELFIFKSGSKRDKLGDLIFVPHPIRTAKYLDQLTAAIDAEAVSKFKLKRGKADA